jgi:hypothetical protein
MSETRENIFSEEAPRGRGPRYSTVDVRRREFRQQRLGRDAVAESLMPVRNLIARASLIPFFVAASLRDFVETAAAEASGELGQLQRSSPDPDKPRRPPENRPLRLRAEYRLTRGQGSNTHFWVGRG